MIANVRRGSHLVAIAAIAATAIFLILEVTELIGGRWRNELRDAFEAITFPDWPLWASGLIGAVLALCGVVLIAAQMAPPKKGLNTVHEVYEGPDGSTRLRGRAAVRAVRHVLEQIEGVVDVDASVAKQTMSVNLRIDDRANIAEVETQARDRLGHQFWIDLGLADFGVNLLVLHHPEPPRVR